VIDDTWRMTTDAAPDRPDRHLDRHTVAVRSAPKDGTPILAIIRRPGGDLREMLTEGVLAVDAGLVGDDWVARGSRSTADGSADPEAQLTLMSTRVLAAIEPDPSRWPLAGDQLLIDLDLALDNLPPGTKLLVGEAELEVSPKPHTGCAKFAARFGHDALRWISTPEGRDLRMRGMYVRVIRGGTVRVGDIVRKA
jgi:hypothetical protein